jgi:FkbM family methyltransferase
LGLETRGIAEVGGVEIEYDTSSVVGRKLLLDGGFEEPEIRFFLERLRTRSRPTVVDVGANIGVHTLRWAAGCPGAHVFSFEPSPPTREALQRNLERNRLGDRVTVVPLALSRQPGTARLLHCRDGAFSSLREQGRQPVAGTFEVEVTTLDAFVADRGLSELALVKIDVEGLELEVVEGGAHTLSTLRPELFVEIFGGSRPGADPERTVEAIRALGYRAFVLVDGVPTPYVRHADALYNYYFTP